MHAARADDHQQAVVRAVEDALDLGAAAEQHVGVAVGQRQLVDQLARGEQRDHPLDPPVADRLAAVLSRWRSSVSAAAGDAGPAPSVLPARAAAAARTASSVAGELVRSGSGWGPSQIASSGSGWTSTMIPSAPAAAAASDIGSTSSRRPAAWLGSTITGRCGRLLEHRDGHQVKREAVGGLERADPALAQDDRLVALLEDVLGGHQQLVQRAGQAALDQDRAARAADLGQQRVVLHVAGADLDHVGDLEHGVEVAGVDAPR